MTTERHTFKFATSDHRQIYMSGTSRFIFLFFFINLTAANTSQTHQHGIDSIIDNQDFHVKTKNLSRFLNYENNAVGAFDELNSLFKEIQFKLPDAQFKASSARNLVMTIQETICFNLHIDDIFFFTHINSNQTNHGNNMTNTIEVKGLSIDCSFQWQMSSSKGRGLINSSGNSIETKISIGLEDGVNRNFPSQIELNFCTATIDITDIDFQGRGLFGFILIALEGAIKKKIESEIKKMACEQFEQLVSSEITSKVDLINRFIEKYSNNNADSAVIQHRVIENLTDSRLSSQTYFNQNNGANEEIIDFMSPESTIEKLLKNILDMFSKFLSSNLDISDIDNNDRDETLLGIHNLGVNKFFKDIILDSNGQFSMNFNKFRYQDKKIPHLYDGEDILTHTTITITAICISGLDTIKYINPLEMLESQTFQTNISWSSIEINLRLMIDMRPSSNSESIIVGKNGEAPKNQTEHIELKMAINNIEASIAMFVALNENVINEAELFALTDFHRILPCILSSIHAVNITELKATAYDITHPVLSGFISSGLDKIFSSISETFVLMYEPLFLQIVPNLIMTAGREYFNEFLLQHLNSVVSRNKCLKYNRISSDGFINLNQLFDSFHQSSKYDDISHLIHNVVHDLTITQDKNRLPNINKKVIIPLTEIQSGEIGVLKFTGITTQISIPILLKHFGVHNISISFDEFRIENLDTIGHPMHILNPSVQNPYKLSNNATISTDERPLAFSSTVNFTFATIEKDFNLNFDLGLEIARETNLSFNIFLQADEEILLTLPLKNVTDPKYWLPSRNCNTGSYEELGKTAISNFHFDGVELYPLSNLVMTINCTSCDEEANNNLALVMSVLKSSGALNIQMQKSIQVLFDLFADIQLQQLFGHYLCSMNSCFDKATPHMLDTCHFQKNIFVQYLFTRNSSEFIASTFLFAIETGIALLTSNTQSLSLTQQNSNDDEELLTKNESWIDFLLLAETNGNIINAVKEQLQEFAIGANTTSDFLKKNNIVRDYFMNVKKSFIFRPNDFVSSIAGFEIKMGSMKIQGLDSLTKFDIFEVVSEHILENFFILDSLRIEFNFTMTTESSNLVAEKKAGWVEEVSLSISMRDIYLEIAMLLGIDRAHFSGIQMGSILDSKNIFPCVMSTVKNSTVSKFNIEIGAFEEINMIGLIFDDAKDALFSSLESIFNLFKTKLMKVFSALTQREINKLLKDYIQIDKAKACVEYQENELNSDVINLHHIFSNSIFKKTSANDGDLIKKVFTHVNNTILAPAIQYGGVVLNDDIVGPITARISGTTGTINLNRSFTLPTMSIPRTNRNVEVVVSELKIGNLDSFGYPISFLCPRKENRFIVDNEIHIGSNGRPLQIAGKLLISIKNELGQKIRNNLDFSIQIYDLHIMSALSIYISTNEFLKLEIKDMNRACWLATMLSPRLGKFSSKEIRSKIMTTSVDFEDFDLTLDCLACKSNEIENFAEMISLLLTKKRVDAFIDNILDSGKLQNKFDQILNNAQSKCHAKKSKSINEKILSKEGKDKEYDRMKVSFKNSPFKGMVFFTLSTSIFIILCTFAAFSMKPILQRARKRRLHLMSRNELVILLDLQQTHSDRMKKVEKLEESTPLRTKIPLKAQIIIPIIIILSIAFFLVSHTSKFASINLQFRVGYLQKSLPKAFEFSMVNLIFEMHSSASKVVAMIIFLVFILWPYIRQMTTLVLWLLPFFHINGTKQTLILKWYHALSKLSMIHIFLFIILIVAMRISIKSSNEYLGDPEASFDIELMLVPQSGLYFDLLGHILSLISLQLVEHYHFKKYRFQKVHEDQYRLLNNLTTNLEATDSSNRNENISKIDEGISKDAESSNQDRNFITHCRALRFHIFQLQFQTDEDRIKGLKLHRAADIVIGLTSFFTIIFILLGVSLPSFSIGLVGIFGVIIEAAETKTQQEAPSYSLLRVCWLIITESLYLNSIGLFIGLVLLALLLIITSVIVPCLLIGSLIFLWFIPMANIPKRHLTNVIDILKTIEFAEVYSLSILLAIFFGNLSNSVLSPYCHTVNGIFGANESCFHIEASLEYAFYFLLLGSLMLRFLTHLIILAASQQHEEDEAFLYKKKCEEDSSHKSSENWKEMKTEEIIDRLVTMPMNFTDIYSWLFQRQST